MRDLATLPKAHVHLHLEGAMRPSTLVDLAAEAGMPVPAIEGSGSFAAFIDVYLAACEVLRTPDEMQRLVREVAEDAKADGAVWVEVHVYPPLHRSRLGSDEAVLEIVLDACRVAAGETGVGVGVVLAADRTVDPADAVVQARLAVRYANDGVVAFGLANDEVGHPPAPFAEAFDIAREAGLLLVPHAGELEGAATVLATLETLRPDRIEHGVRAVEDPGLVRRLADERVVLDVCLSSNLLLSVFPSVEEHALPRLLEAGVLVTLNADDPLMFGPNILDEYELVRASYGLGDAAMAAIAATSVEASGAPKELKDTALAGIEAWLRS